MEPSHLHNKKIPMVIAPEQFRDEELLEQKGVPEHAGAKVTVVSKRLGKATGMLGATCQPRNCFQRLVAESSTLFSLLAAAARPLISGTMRRCRMVHAPTE